MMWEIGMNFSRLAFVAFWATICYRGKVRLALALEDFKIDISGS